MTWNSVRVYIREIQYKLKILKLLRSDIRNAKFPKLVVLQSLNRCNCGCSMCPYSYTVAKEDESRMTQELFEKIVYELSGQTEFSSMIFAFQNEPLLDQRLISWAKFYKKLMPDKQLELVTNGSLLSAEKAKDVFKYFDTVHISLNAFSRETYGIVTNTDHYDRVVENIRHIGKTREWREKTIIRFIGQRTNYKEKKSFYRYWRSLGFMVFGFDVNDRLGDVKDFDKQIKLPSNFFRNIKLKMFKYAGRIILPTCPIPFICIYFKANGEVVQCFNDWTNKHSLGDVSKSSIQEIFNNEAYCDIRKRLLNGKLDDVVICQNCDLYKEGIWLTV